MLLLPFGWPGPRARSRIVALADGAGRVGYGSSHRCEAGVHDTVPGMAMPARLARSMLSRRRLVGGLAAIGLSLVAAGCDGKLPIVPTPPAGAPPRRNQPAPLAPAGAP